LRCSPAINRTDDALDVMLTMPNARVIIICMKNKVLPDFYAAARAVLEEASVLCGEPIPLSECKIISPHKLNSLDFLPRSVMMIAAPYYSRAAEGSAQCRRTLSLYAVPRDYHIFFSELFAELRERLAPLYPGTKFACFADNSPIGEVAAASKAGLGMIGESGLLITKRFGSFVFLGEIISDIEVGNPGKTYDIKRCDGCGRCTAACPCECTDVADKKNRCLSALTQSKKDPDEETLELMRREGTVWGCDVCQLVCPYNENPEETPIQWFRRDLILAPTENGLAAMTDEEFRSRAFAWRGRSVIGRNLKALGGDEN
jgi:epoxyqueuosine reductase